MSKATTPEPTIEQRDEVMRQSVEHITCVGNLLAEAIAQLTHRAINHDGSKFSEHEFPTFALETPLLRQLTYGSPAYGDSIKRLGPALAHHYQANSHHPEHYFGGMDEMDLLDLLEMLADWKAATERHADGSLANSFSVNRTHFKIGQQLERILWNTAKRLGWIEPATTQARMPTNASRD